MMSSNLQQLTRVFLSLGFGLWLSVYHSLVYVRAPHKPVKTFKRACLDWFFVTGSGVMFFFFLLAVNAGTVRLGMAVAVLLGFAVGRRTVGQWTRRLLTLFRRIAAVIGRCVASLLERVFSVLQNLFKKSDIFFKKVLHYVCSLVYNRKR